MAVVAPISAIAAAALPALVGFATGERPGHRAGDGRTRCHACDLARVGRSGRTAPLEPGRRDRRPARRTGLRRAVLRARPGSACSGTRRRSPVSQVVSVSSIVIGAAAISEPWLPRDRFSRLGAVAGVLAGIATICFQLRRAVRNAHDRRGARVALSGRHRSPRGRRPARADRARAGDRARAWRARRWC